MADGALVAAGGASGRSEAAPGAFHAGTLEALKWAAFALMLADHANRFVLGGRLPGAYEAGRLALPLFAFVLAQHLAQAPDTQAACRRVLTRLALALAAALPAAVLLAGWWPAPVLATLALAVAIIRLLAAGGAARAAAAAALFVGGGLLVEFWWAGVAVPVAAWAWCRRPTALRALAWGMAVAALAAVNGNGWALAAFAVLAAARPLRLAVPRWRHGFYAAYPVHLAVLAAWRLLVA